MSNDHDDQQSLPIEAEPIPYSGVTPGQLLRKVREARGQTVAEVAAALRLRISLIEAIEADDYQALNGSTFVRGYFRSLAKLYDIDPHPLATAYEAMGYGAPAVSTLKMQSFSRRKIREKNDGRLMVVSYVIIAAVIGAALVWWWQQPSSSTTEMPQRSSIEAQPREAQSDTEVATSTPELQASSEFAAAAADSAMDSIPESANESATDSAAESAADSAADSSTDSATDSATESATDSATDSAAADNLTTNTADSATTNAADVATNSAADNAAATAAEPAAVPAAAPASDQLTMAFNQRCWVKVSDASGAEIAIGVKDAGYEMPLTGRAPFDIILCKPEALTMTLNGSAVDLSQYRRNRSVTLRLE